MSIFLFIFFYFEGNNGGFMKVGKFQLTQAEVLFSLMSELIFRMSLFSTVS